MTLMLVGLVSGERIQTRVGLEVRGAEEIKTELRSLTKERRMWMQGGQVQEVS